MVNASSASVLGHVASQTRPEGATLGDRERSMAKHIGPVPEIRYTRAREATMEQRTHEQIASHLCGRPVELAPGRARVVLETTAEMAADQRGLVHGGFTFGLADYAAMLAVNEPPVVLASAQVKFLGPVVVGDRVEAEFVAFVPDRHILDASPLREPRP